MVIILWETLFLYYPYAIIRGAYRAGNSPKFRRMALSTIRFFLCLILVADCF
nr:MAG TPA: hypothetical protein [Caudoviricetes sp.]